MAVLTSSTRKKMPRSEFALPGGRYPIEDKEHARKALQLGPRSVAKGNTTPAEMSEIREKVHAKYPSIGKGSKLKLSSLLH